MEKFFSNENLPNLDKIVEDPEYKDKD